ncbi:MAG: hypothetical protein ACK4TB_13985 [Gemmobacter sp.]
MAVLLVALALGACATPQEACIAAATRDLRVLDRLIAQTEANIARGYALVPVTTTETRFVPCAFAPRVVTLADGSRRIVDDGPRFCWRDEAVTVEQPRAIDMAAERRILASSRAERARKAREAERVVAACRVQYPGG